MSRNFLFLCLILAVGGCGDTKGNGPATSKLTAAPTVDASHADEAATAESQDGGPDLQANEERSLTTRQAFAEAKDLLKKNDIEGVVGVLEQALPGNPDDVNLLLSLAQFTAALASSDRQKPDYAQCRKSGDYLRRALAVKPAIAKNPAVRNLAGPVYYYEACSLALDNQADLALTRLSEAVEFGFNDLAKIDGEANLKSVRELAGYAEFKAKAEDELRAQAEADHARLVEEVEGIFAENVPFDFNFALRDIDGKPIALADFEGKVVIVDVWGTWCPPCRREIPHFVALQEKFKQAGLEIVGLNSERAADQEQATELVRNFRQENGMNYRCALVNDDTLRQIPEFNAFPTTMFIDRNGHVRAKLLGYHDYEKLEIVVRKLLDEKRATGPQTRG